MIRQLTWITILVSGIAMPGWAQSVVTPTEPKTKPKSASAVAPQTGDTKKATSGSTKSGGATKSAPKSGDAKAGDATKASSKAGSTKSSSSSTTKSKTAIKAPQFTRSIDTEISGVAGGDSDTLLGRIRYDGSNPGLRWSSRSSCTLGVSESQSSTKINKTKTTTLRLNNRLEWPSGESYRYLSHGMSLRKQKRNGKITQPHSGYQLASFGLGREFGKRFRADIGVGSLRIYDKQDRMVPVGVMTLRGKIPITKLLSLDSDIMGMLPCSGGESGRIDSDLALSYQMAQGLFLRLGWSGTNLLRDLNSKRDWDSSIRLSIGFRETKSH